MKLLTNVTAIGLSTSMLFTDTTFIKNGIQQLKDPMIYHRNEGIYRE